MASSFNIDGAVRTAERYISDNKFIVDENGNKTNIRIEHAQMSDSVHDFAGGRIKYSLFYRCYEGKSHTMVLPNGVQHYYDQYLQNIFGTANFGNSSNLPHAMLKPNLHTVLNKVNYPDASVITNNDPIPFESSASTNGMSHTRAGIEKTTMTDLIDKHFQTQCISERADPNENRKSYNSAFRRCIPDYNSLNAQKKKIYETDALLQLKLRNQVEGVLNEYTDDQKALFGVSQKQNWYDAPPTIRVMSDFAPDSISCAFGIPTDPVEEVQTKLKYRFTNWTTFFDSNRSNVSIREKVRKTKKNGEVKITKKAKGTLFNIINVFDSNKRFTVQTLFSEYTFIQDASNQGFSIQRTQKKGLTTIHTAKFFDTYVYARDINRYKDVNNIIIDEDGNRATPNYIYNWRDGIVYSRVEEGPSISTLVIMLFCWLHKHAGTLSENDIRFAVCVMLDSKRIGDEGIATSVGLMNAFTSQLHDFLGKIPTGNRESVYNKIVKGGSDDFKSMLYVVQQQDHSAIIPCLIHRIPFITRTTHNGEQRGYVGFLKKSILVDKVQKATTHSVMSSLTQGALNWTTDAFRCITGVIMNIPPQTWVGFILGSAIASVGMSAVRPLITGSRSRSRPGTRSKWKSASRSKYTYEPSMYPPSMYPPSSASIANSVMKSKKMSKMPMKSRRSMKSALRSKPVSVIMGEKKRSLQEFNMPRTTMSLSKFMHRLSKSGSESAYAHVQKYVYGSEYRHYLMSLSEDALQYLSVRLHTEFQFDKSGSTYEYTIDYDHVSNQYLWNLNQSVYNENYPSSSGYNGVNIMTPLFETKRVYMKHTKNTKPKKSKVNASNAPPKLKTNTQSKPKSSTRPKATPKPSAQPKPRIQSKPKTTTSKPKTSVQPKPKTTTSKPKSSAQPKPKTSTQPKPKTSVQPKPKLSAQSKPKPKPSVKPKPKLKVKSKNANKKK